MTSSGGLALRAAGRALGRLDVGRDGRLLLFYDDAWLETPGAYPLSLTLPLQPEPHEGEKVALWLDGLLPYGELREQLEAWRLDADDAQRSPAGAIGLLSRLGGDAPGAAVFTPEGRGSLRPVESLETLLENWAATPLLLGEDGVSHTLCEETDERLPVHLGVGEEPQIALALRGAPSTHLLWLEPKSAFGELENRAYHLALAAMVGLRISGFRTFAGAGRRMLLTPRDDRERRGEGCVRLHRETLAQAMGARPEQRYGREQGPFADLETVFLWADGALPARERLRLLDAFLFNALIGSPHGHLLRFAIRLQPAPSLAPLTELAAPGFTPPKDRRFSHRVGGALRWPERISVVHWRAFAEAARLNQTFMLDRLAELAQFVANAAEPAAAKLEIDPHLQGAILGRLAREAKERALDVVRRLQRNGAAGGEDQGGEE